MKFFLSDESRTREFGAELGKILLPGDVVALYGQLGAGKTTLVRGLVQHLCGKATEVPSPTYTLVQSYETTKFVIWHFDLYRIESLTELDELGWEDTADAVVLVEWPERSGDRLPKSCLDVKLSNLPQQGRKVAFAFRDHLWEERLASMKFPLNSRLL